MRKIWGMYLVMAMVSYYIISGITFARFEGEFGDSHRRFPSVVTLDEARRDCLNNHGFAMGWSILASAYWPVFLPGLYVTSGYAYDGVWTKYNFHYCRDHYQEVKG